MPQPLIVPMIFTSLTISLAFAYALPNNLMLMMEWSIAPILNSYLSLTLMLDPNGLLMAAAVCLIASCVLAFSSTYMCAEPFYTRFHYIILLFVASMLALIFLPNLVTMLIGWDGLGLTSFLLVIYYSNAKSLSAGMLTALTNRIGDALLLVAIGYLSMDNNWNMPTLWPDWANSPVPILIMLAASTKSAQFPFSSWLPAAMAAPTPVSALVHSSTLVTAGVFILLRSSQAISASPLWSPMLLSMGALTMLMAGASAVTECDLKKIVALSTLSQLGLMVFTLGLGAPLLAMFHLITHALFKALLFISAGTIIFFNSHSQDLRTTGPLAMMPITSASLLVANAALCGMPFLAAFYSKDLIIESAFFIPLSPIFLLVLFVATSFTTTYTARLLLTMLWAPTNSSPTSSFDEDPMMSPVPMTTLTCAAIVAGAALNWVMVLPHLSAPMTVLSKMAPCAMMLMGLSLALCLPNLHWPSAYIPTITSFHQTMWFLVPLSSQAILPSLTLTSNIHTIIDQGWQEVAGGQGLNALAKLLFNNTMQVMVNIPTLHLALSISAVSALLLT